MKRVKIIMSLLAFVCGIAGAFATKTSFANVTRYEKFTTNPVCRQVTCSDVVKTTLCGVTANLHLGINGSGVCINPADDDFIYRAD